MNRLRVAKIETLLSYYELFLDIVVLEYNCNHNTCTLSINNTQLSYFPFTPTSSFISRLTKTTNNVDCHLFLHQLN